MSSSASPAEPGPTDSEQDRSVPHPGPDPDNEAFRDGAFDLFRKTMRQTRMAVCLTDPHQRDNPIVFANRAFQELSGYDEHEIVGRNCRFMQGPKTDRAAVSKMREAIDDEDVTVLEVLNYRKDGSTFWNALHLGPLYDEAGNLKYYFGSQWDVSDVHAARHGEQQAKLLARELSHRVKNMFAVISSVVSLTGRHRGATGVAREINDRIHALARAYETTLDNASDRHAGLVPLIEAVLAPYGYGGKRSRIEMEGEPIDMPGATVSVLGLTLHELATNAVKYGALGDDDDGRVAVSWTQVDGADGKALVLRWRETGGPEPASVAPDRGTGSAIVLSLLQSAYGTIEYDWRPEGLLATITLPVNA